MQRERWRVWDADSAYGDVFFRRATGDLPEMECSKAVALHVQRHARETDIILDVGCGAGHYLRSLRGLLGPKFTYQGVDATASYIELARKAFREDTQASFKVSDIYHLDLEDAVADITLCCNVLLHLPSIEHPLAELVRVSRRTVILRLLCGERSYRIMDVYPQEDGMEFDDSGEPNKFCYYNIYSEAYLNAVIGRMERVASVSCIVDNSFGSAQIAESATEHASKHNATTMLANHQVNGYILQPWAFVIIQLEAP